MFETNRSEKDDLKAERIQDRLTAAELAGAPFTPDRIEALVRGLPGWLPMQNGRGIWRPFTFGTTDAAVAFVGLVAKIGQAARHAVRLVMQGKKVACFLDGGADKPMSFVDYKLARKIGLQE